MISSPELTIWLTTAMGDLRYQVAHTWEPICVQHKIDGCWAYTYSAPLLDEAASDLRRRMGRCIEHGVKCMPFELADKSP